MKTLDAKTRIQLNNILFATDLSPTATAALPYAAGLAKHFGANLFALHVRTPVINPMTPPADWPALEKATGEEDREQKQMLRNSLPGVPITILLEESDIWTNLRALTKRKDIDLLVLGTHGRSGIGKLLLGSVAEEILREAECPVLTIGPYAPAQPNRGGAFTRILYAASFGSESTALAAYAISLAQEYQAKLTLLHVLEDPAVGDLVIPHDLLESFERRLAGLVPHEAEPWCAPDYRVERGDAAQTILRVAQDTAADLIVLGVHEPTGVPGAATHLPIGTVHRVVSHARCPVLTIRG